MNDDRELLELAAKAAGIDLSDATFRNGKFVFITPHKPNWNPLSDDGDALRLAVKLTLEIDICHTGIAVRSPIGLKTLVDASDEQDPYAATRRAITRAAAEIGRQGKD